MNIYGIGTDIVQKSRIEKLFENYGERFIKRILTPLECSVLNAHHDAVSYLAKRFAAKEALAKALGTGLGQELSFIDLSILNDKNGKPYIEWVDPKHKHADKVFHISLSDEKKYAQAFVIALSPG